MRRCHSRRGGLLPQWPPSGRAHSRRSSAFLALQWCESRRRHHCAYMVGLSEDPASTDGLSCCPKDVERSKPQDIIIRESANRWNIIESSKAFPDGALVVIFKHNPVLLDIHDCCADEYHLPCRPIRLVESSLRG